MATQIPYSFDSDPGTLGGINWGSVLGEIGGQAAQAGLAMLFGGGRGARNVCLQGQVSGDQAMTNCVPQVMALFNDLESQIGILPPDQIIAGANQIAGIFSDGRFFDQGIGGRSREIRERAKTEARTRANAIIGRVSAAAVAVINTPVTTDPVTGQPANPSPGLKLDTQTIVIGGLAALLLIMWIKN